MSTVLPWPSIAETMTKRDRGNDEKSTSPLVIFNHKNRRRETLTKKDFIFWSEKWKSFRYFEEFMNGVEFMGGV